MIQFVETKSFTLSVHHHHDQPSHIYFLRVLSGLIFPQKQPDWQQPHGGVQLKHIPFKSMKVGHDPSTSPTHHEHGSFQRSTTPWKKASKNIPHNNRQRGSNIHKTCYPSGQVILTKFVVRIPEIRLLHMFSGCHLIIFQSWFGSTKLKQQLQQLSL